MLPVTIPAINFKERYASIPNSSGFLNDIKTIALEITKAEHHAVSHTLSTIKHPDKNIFVNC